jgi:hypothetical protein
MRGILLDYLICVLISVTTEYAARILEIKISHIMLAEKTRVQRPRVSKIKLK